MGYGPAPASPRTVIRGSAPSPAVRPPAVRAHLCTHLLDGVWHFDSPSDWMLRLLRIVLPSGCRPLHVEKGVGMDGLGVGQFGDARLEKGGAFSAAHGRAIDGAAEAIGLPSRRGSQVRPFSAQ